MATIEQILGLGKDGWQEIASMDDAKLQEYLKDITNLENKSRIVNVISNEEEEDIKDIKEKDISSNPFTKANNKKTKRKLLSTYNIDIDAEKLKKELEDL